MELNDLIRSENEKKAANKRAYDALLEAGANGKPLPGNTPEILTAVGVSAEQLRGEIAARKLKATFRPLDETADRLAGSVADAKKILAKRYDELAAVRRQLGILAALDSVGERHAGELNEFVRSIEGDIQSLHRRFYESGDKLTETLGRLRSAKGEQQRIVADELAKWAAEPLGNVVPSRVEPAGLSATVLEAIARIAIRTLQGQPNGGEILKAFAEAAAAKEQSP